MPITEAGGIAEGLASGVGLATNLFNSAQHAQHQNKLDSLAEQRAQYLNKRDSLAEQHQQFTDNILTQQNQRNENSSKIRDAATTLKAVDSESLHLTHQMALNTYGGNFDPQLQKQHEQEVTQLADSRRQAMSTLTGQKAFDTFQQGKQDMKALQEGQTTPEQLGPTKFAMGLTTAFHRPYTDFISQDGRPSVVSQASEQLSEGLKNGNRPAVVSAANTIFAPELKSFIGKVGHNGSKVTDAEFTAFHPSPNDPKEVVPMVQLTTVDAFGHQGTQVVPVTVDPNDQTLHPVINGQSPVATFSMQQLFDKAGKLTTAAAALSPPASQQLLKQANAAGARTPVQEYLYASSQLGTDPYQWQPKYDHVVKDGHILMFNKHDGSLVSDRPLKYGGKESDLQTLIHSGMSPAQASMIVHGHTIGAGRGTPEYVSGSGRGGSSAHQKIINVPNPDNPDGFIGKGPKTVPAVVNPDGSYTTMKEKGGMPAAPEAHPGVSAQTEPGQQPLPKLNNAAEYGKLPKGAQYMKLEGGQWKTYTKSGGN